MRMSRAAVLTEYDAPLKIMEFPVPETLEPGAALVRVQMAGVCGTDVHLWHGQLPIPLPVILGHETVGVIERLSDELKKDWAGLDLAVSDRVTWTSSLVCGHCFYCRIKKQPTRCLNRKAYGISYKCTEPPHLLGGYADYIYLRPGTSIFKIPQHLPTEAVVGAGCALVTSLHGLEHIRVEWGDVVVVQGSGPVGLACLALAKDSGAAKVIMVGGPEHRLEAARKFGADDCIDVSKTSSGERAKQVMELSGGFGADVGLECVGIPQAVNEGLELLRDGGRYLILGHYGDAGTIPFNPHIVTKKQLTLGGSWGFEPRHTRAALGFLSRTRSRFPFETTTSTRFSLEKADDALQSTARWAGTKSVIVP